MITDTVPAVESATSVPRWRSLFYVPAHIPRADGLILDLDDSVPQNQKGDARGSFPIP